MKTRAARLESTIVGGLGALPQSRMDVRVIDLVEIFPKPLHEWLQRPYGQFFRIDRLRHLPDVARHLSIAQQVVEELRIGRAVLWRSLLCGAELGAARQGLEPLGFART